MVCANKLIGVSKICLPWGANPLGVIIRDVVIYHLDEFIPEEVDFVVK